MKRSRMTSKELEEFLRRHDLTNKEFAALIGLTEPAIHHWLSGVRNIQPPVVKLTQLIDKYPKLIAEF